MAAKAGFSNWEQLKDHIPPTDKPFRSGAPNYFSANKETDKHSLDKKTIDFLKTSGIKHVISLNSQAVTNTEIKEKLQGAGIVYTPLPVKDFTAPIREQLATGNKEYEKHRDGTLVWCGFGHGRTGTMITGLQIYAIKPCVRLGEVDYRKNHVEQYGPNNKSTGQFKVFDELQNSFKTELMEVGSSVGFRLEL